jgi:IS30 family transposase
MEKFIKLDYENRLEIDFMLNKEHKNYTQIAYEIGCAKNTISREVNLDKVKAIKRVIYKKDNRFKLINNKFIYKANYAQKQADKRTKKSKKKIKLNNNNQLYNNVSNMLKNGKKPDVISGILKRIYQNKEYEFSISHECIYQYIYNNLDTGLYEYLGIKKARIKRKHHSKRKTWLQNKNRKKIKDRPVKANNRIELGHFEIDLIVGSSITSHKSILTLTDRKSRKNYARFCKDKSADEVYKKLKEIINEIGDTKYIKSITADNGREFSNYIKLYKELNITTYFADPYCSWQRGTN